ncbi:MAG: hypothetical protein QM820_27845 [Minicystis sp.]
MNHETVTDTHRAAPALPALAAGSRPRAPLHRAGWLIASAPLLFTLGCSFSVPPPVPVGAPVPVSFSAPSASSPPELEVSGEGRTLQRCELPCAMQVPSGSALLTVSGPRKVLVSAVIPAEPAKAEIRFKRRGQAIAGWVITLAGLAGSGIALGVTRNAGPDGQLKGGIAGAALAGVGLVGLIVALTAGSDEVSFTKSTGEAKTP